jgi:adenylate cyclase
MTAGFTDIQGFSTISEKLDLAVNLASRLEGVNKQYHTVGILISGSTKEKIGDEFVCRSLDRVRVVGINTPVRLYELLGLRNEMEIRETDYLAA